MTLAFPKLGIYGPTYGVLVAALLQIIIQIPGLLKQGVQYSFVWNLNHPGLREVLRLLIPNVLAVAVGSVSVFVDTAFASYLPDSASLAALHNAQMLYGVPAALVGQALGPAVLPHLSVQATSGRYIRMRQTVLQMMVVSLLFTVPAALLFWLFGGPLIHLLFQHGAFDAHASALTNWALLGYVIGLPGIAAGELLANGFFGLKDTTTPLVTNTFALVTRYGLILLFLHMLSGIWVILAIPLATSVSATADVVLMVAILLWRLRSKVKMDKGMLRLQRRRLYARRREKAPSVVSNNDQEQLLVVAKKNLYETPRE